ncbi:MAG: hypothetical protein ACOC7W_05870 [Desulfosalsimonas sp.]
MEQARKKDREVDFTHPVLNEPVSAIGGEYLFEREHVAEAGGGQVIYFTGYFMLDRSCCGVGGCAYALVAGFVRQRKYRSESDGRQVSLVEPVDDPETRRRIESMIKESDPLMQVAFFRPSGGTVGAG